MIKKMEEGYDIVIGSRFVGEKKPFTMRMLGSNLIEMAIRFTTGVNIKDPTSGMRMFSKRMIREFASGLNYGPEPDTVSYLIRQGARVAEVPVIMDERILGVSYLTPVNAMRYMLKMLISILLIQNFRKGGSAMTPTLEVVLIVVDPDNLYDYEGRSGSQNSRSRIRFSGWDSRPFSLCSVSFRGCRIFWRSWRERTRLPILSIWRLFSS